jgi:hypothetical protein
MTVPAPVATEPTRATHRLVLRQATVRSAVMTFRRGAIVQIRESKHEDWRWIVAASNIWDESTHVTVTLTGWLDDPDPDLHDDEVYRLDHEVRLRIWYPLTDEQMARFRPLPPPDQRTAGDIELAVGDIITVRPHNGIPFKTVVVDIGDPNLTNQRNPDSTLIQPWGEIRNMRGQRKWSRKHGSQPTPKVIWVRDIESIERAPEPEET